MIKYEGECIKIWNESNHKKIAFNLQNNCSYLAVTRNVLLNPQKYEWE